MNKELCLEMLEPARLPMLIWGDADVVFIKSGVVDGCEIWKIFGADGTELAIAESRDCAFLIARQNGMEPKSTH